MADFGRTVQTVPEEPHGATPRELRICLAAAACWEVLVLTGALTLPIFHFGPPAGETVFQHSHALVIVLALVGAGCLGLGWWRLEWRIRAEQASPANEVVALGIALAAFSVLGWIPGVLTIGGFGALVALSGRRLRRTNHGR